MLRAGQAARPWSLRKPSRGNTIYSWRDDGVEAAEKQSWYLSTTEAGGDSVSAIVEDLIDGLPTGR